MKTVETIAELRAICGEARASGRTVGFVPTMGSFHAGHRSLMSTARAETGLVVVSLFVNPTQFGPNEDLGAYPMDLDGDIGLAASVGVDVLFRPSVEEMYPGGAMGTTVHVSGLSDGMCAAARPTHFDGVSTIVTKLFSIVGPCRSYFGRKDYQQLAIVRRMASDLDLPVTVVGCPLVREADGLALSSRNAYLTPAERAAVPVLHAALTNTAVSIRAGERRAAAVTEAIWARVASEPLVALEYVEVRDAESLESRDEVAGAIVVALAARVGRARLIDNMVFTVDDTGVSVDAGVGIGADGLAPDIVP